MFFVLSTPKKITQRFVVRVLLKVTVFRSRLKPRNFLRLIRDGTVTA